MGFRVSPESTHQEPEIFVTHVFLADFEIGHPWFAVGESSGLVKNYCIDLQYPPALKSGMPL